MSIFSFFFLIHCRKLFYSLMDKQIITKDAGIKIKDGSPLLQEMGVVYYLLYVGLVVDNLDLSDFL